MLKSNKILYSEGNNDECYTPKYAVLPIIEYIPKNFIVWCPFDKEESNFVIEIRKAGFEVICSHIDDGKDFFTYEPENWNIIISNPPFSDKRKFFERAISFEKPFALLMTNTWLNDSAPKQIFKEKDLQLLMFDKRINYINNKNFKHPTFSSSYYCYNFLPKQIIMKNLEIKEE